jgi:acyl-coenzyme A synthetase/AMP-(fatty) acid ligase/aryl carrier-like protein
MPVAPLNHLVTNAPVLPDLREVFVAGEPLVLAPLLRFLAVNPELALFNQYGPTEASVIVTEHRVETGGPPAPPIGTLIDNIVGRVVDETDVPVPVGAVGELLVGGVAVAAGYLGDEDRTRQRFVTISGVRFYRTGDLVRLTNGGVLAYLGRLDEQVKIRGYRVEPGETRTALCGLAEVIDCAVLVDRTAAQPTLSAYVVLGEPLDDWVHVLRGRLARQLPSYLVPQRWTEVDELPIGSNGKLDRNRLAPAEPVGPRGAPARTETECAVQRIWCAELDATAIPVDRSLFDVGGDSLTLVRLLERMRSDLGSAPPVADFMREPTIQALATWFEEIR